MLALMVGNSLLQLLNFLSGLSYLCIVQKTFASAQGGELGTLRPVEPDYRPRVSVGQFLFYTTRAG